MWEEIERQCVIITKCDVEGGGWKRRKKAYEYLSKTGINYKRLVSGYAALAGSDFPRFERRIRKALRVGTLDFLNSRAMPPYKLFDGFKKKNIEFVYGDPSLPVELGSTVGCHIHDGYMGAITVRDQAREAVVVARLLSQIVVRKLGSRAPRIAQGLMRSSLSKNTATWKRLRKILLTTGITGRWEDVRLRRGELLMTCYDIHPEWSRGSGEKLFTIECSLKREQWSLSEPKQAGISLRNCILVPRV